MSRRNTPPTCVVLKDVIKMKNSLEWCNNHQTSGTLVSVEKFSGQKRFNGETKKISGVVVCICISLHFTKFLLLLGGCI